MDFDYLCGMEFLNNIELQGIVGRVHGDARLTTFSLVVEEDRTKEGENIIETIWFNCRADGEVNIIRGTWVNVKGRLRMRKNASRDGVTYDVIVKELTII